MNVSLTIKKVYMQTSNYNYFICIKHDDVRRRTGKKAELLAKRSGGQVKKTGGNCRVFRHGRELT